MIGVVGQMPFKGVMKITKMLGNFRHNDISAPKNSFLAFVLDFPSIGFP
jgi:hypothetical protein